MLRRPDAGLSLIHIFLWVTLPEGVSALSLFPKALEKKVAFVPGDPFYIHMANTNTMRLNYTNADCGMIDEGIRRLGAVSYTHLDVYKRQAEHGFQVGVPAGSGSPLHVTEIRAACHAHITIAPGLGSNPVQGIVAVFHFIIVGYPAAGTAVSAPHILQNHCIPSLLSLIHI